MEVKGATAEIASEEVDAEKVVARDLGKRSKSKLIVFPGSGCCRQPSSRTCKSIELSSILCYGLFQDQINRNKPTIS